MNQELRLLKPYYRYSDIALATAAILLFMPILGFWLSSFWRLLPVSFSKHGQYLFFTAINSANYSFANYRLFLSQHAGGAVEFWAIPSLFTIAGFWFCIKFIWVETDPVQHLRGRRFLVGSSAIKSAKLASKKLIKTSEKGLELVPNVFLGRAKELQSVLVMGAQGGGKTVFINGILQKIIARGDKCVIYDLTKGDFTGWVDCPIISPSDARSHIWAIGQDLIDLADASSFANSMILTNDKDPFWSNTSQNVLIAITLKLQHENGTKWGFSELSELIFSTEIEDLKQICETFYPPANGSLVDAESKMTGSIVVNLRSFCAPIYRLNQQWQNVDKHKKISLIAWLNNDESKCRQIIIQGDQRDSVLSAALARAVTNLLSIRIASLQFSESKIRRLWFVLDELPQIGRLENITKLLEIGRSKGVACIFGFQDISQIRQIYAKDEDQKWLALFGLKIFPKVQGSLSQNWVAAEIGEREVQYLSKSISANFQGSSSNLNYQKESIPVILPSQLDSDFGPAKNGINALVLGLGSDVLRLNFSYPTIYKIRNSFVPWPAKKPAIKKELVAVIQSAPAVIAPVENFNKSIFNLLDGAEEKIKSDLKIADEDDSKNWPVVDFGRETTGGTRGEGIRYQDKSEVCPFGLTRLATENELKKYKLASAKSNKSDPKSEPELEENELKTEIGESIMTEIVASTLGVSSTIFDVAKQLIGATEAIKSDPKSEQTILINQTHKVKKLTNKERLAQYEAEQD